MAKNFYEMRHNNHPPFRVLTGEIQRCPCGTLLTAELLINAQLASKDAKKINLFQKIGYFFNALARMLMNSLYDKEKPRPS